MKSYSADMSNQEYVIVVTLHYGKMKPLRSLHPVLQGSSSTEALLSIRGEVLDLFMDWSCSNAVGEVKCQTTCRDISVRLTGRRWLSQVKGDWYNHLISSLSRWTLRDYMESGRIYFSLQNLKGY